MEEIKILFEARGMHYKTIKVKKNICECYECKLTKQCLIFDSSDDEYSDIIFCNECLNDFFNDKVSISTYDNDLSNQQVKDV